MNVFILLLGGCFTCEKCGWIGAGKSKHKLQLAQGLLAKAAMNSLQLNVRLFIALGAGSYEP